MHMPMFKHIPMFKHVANVLCVLMFKHVAYVRKCGYAGHVLAQRYSLLALLAVLQCKPYGLKPSKQHYRFFSA